MEFNYKWSSEKEEGKKKPGIFCENSSSFNNQELKMKNTKKAKKTGQNSINTGLLLLMEVHFKKYIAQVM